MSAAPASAIGDDDARPTITADAPRGDETGAQWRAALASPWWIVPVVPAVEAAARSWPAAQGLPTEVVAVALAHLAGRWFGSAALPAIYTLALFFVADVPSLYAPGNWWTIPAMLIAARLGYDADLRGAIVASGRPADVADGGTVRLRYIHPMVGEVFDGGVLGALLLVTFVFLGSFWPDFALRGNPLTTLVPLLCGILGARQVPLRSLLPSFAVFAACVWLASPISPHPRIAAELNFMVGSWPTALLDCAVALFVGRALSRPLPMLDADAHYRRLGAMILLWFAVLLAVQTGIALRLPDPLRSTSTGETHSFVFRVSGWTLPMLAAVLCWSVDDLRDRGEQGLQQLSRLVGLGCVYAGVSLAAAYFVPYGLTLTLDGWQRGDNPGVEMPPILIACVAAMLFSGWLRRHPLPVSAGSDPAAATLAALLGRVWTVVAFGTPWAVATVVAALMLASPDNPMAAFRPVPAAPRQAATATPPAAEPASAGVSTSRSTADVGPSGMPGAVSSSADAATAAPSPPARASLGNRTGRAAARRATAPRRGGSTVAPVATAPDVPPALAEPQAQDIGKSPQQQSVLPSAAPDPLSQVGSDAVVDKK